ncbi:hypothetical protein BGY98DRAFT_1091270 [Russula aff. rugulosa BPL654]|nr:hypothetical protein BGY98DRAFT_1091270 [Russula aff. rugulosa BPL654]
MGKFIWHEHARYVAITASVYTVWAGYFGLIYRKFFWDFVSGTLRNPGGLQPAKQDAFFIDIIVKAPVIPIISIILGLVIIALEYPAPFMKGLAAQRSMICKVVLLFFQAFFAILFYQVPIRPAFDKGKASGDLLFFPSQIHTHKDKDLAIDLDRAREGEGEAGDDVFKPPYNPNLYVGELKDEDEGTEYVVLLNKYSVVEEHFLLVTKEFQSQTSPLSYLLLRAARAVGKHVFAFYNCGDRSGASQPHKHLQFFPTENEDGPPIERLARAARIDKDDKPFALSTLPFANHVRRLALPVSATHGELEPALIGAFIELLELCISTVRHTADYPVGPPSYNVVLTLGHMYAHLLAVTREPLGVNALGFAGLLLVKSPAELEAVKAEGPGNVLRGVACESVHEMQVADGLELDGNAGPAA